MNDFDFKFRQVIRIKAGKWSHVTWPENATAEVRKRSYGGGGINVLPLCTTVDSLGNLRNPRSGGLNGCWYVPFDAILSIEPEIQYLVNNNGIIQHHETIDNALKSARLSVCNWATLSEWDKFEFDVLKNKCATLISKSGVYFSFIKIKQDDEHTRYNP